MSERKLLKDIVIPIEGFDFLREPTQEELQKCKEIDFYGTYIKPTESGERIRCLTSNEQCILHVKELRKQRKIDTLLIWLSILIAIAIIIVGGIVGPTSQIH